MVSVFLDIVVPAPVGYVGYKVLIQHTDSLAHIPLCHLQAAPLRLDVYTLMQYNHLISKFRSPRFGDNVNYKPQFVDYQDVFPKLWIILLTVEKLCIIIKDREGVFAVYVHLKELRESLGMTQEEFGKSIGIAKSTYNNYEKGIRDPKSDFWVTVAHKYGVTIDYLMGYCNDPHGTSVNTSKARPLLAERLQAIVGEYSHVPDGDKLIERLLRMNPDEQWAALEFLIKVLSALARSNAENSHATESTQPHSESEDTAPPPDAPETPPKD